MFQLDTNGVYAATDNARFETFKQAADCAMVHAAQRGDCQVSGHTGELLADFLRLDGGKVGIVGLLEGRAMAVAWMVGEEATPAPRRRKRRTVGTPD